MRMRHSGLDSMHPPGWLCRVPRLAKVVRRHSRRSSCSKLRLGEKTAMSSARGRKSVKWRTLLSALGDRMRVGWIYAGAVRIPDLP